MKSTRLMLRNWALSAALFVSVNSFAATFAPGTYQVNGKHSVYGQYAGVLSVNDRGYVQRWIHFTPQTSEQIQSLGLQGQRRFEIQQLWEGAQSNVGPTFTIRLSNVLTRFNDFAPNPADFSFETVQLTSNTVVFQLKNDGFYSETYAPISKTPTALFSPDTRTKLDAYGVTSSFLVNVASWAGVQLAIDEYRKLPHFDSYRSREEFKKNQVFKIKDLTDLDFYRQNDSILRIRNKSLTPLAIGEALQRRAAYHPTLAQKENYKTQETQKLMNELGLMEESIVTENGAVVQRIPQGDSMLWFGVYTWSLYLENQTKNTDASYAQFRQAVSNFGHLIEISPDPTKFARYIHKSPPEEPSNDPNVKQGTGIYAAYKYDSRSNNDMVKGIFLNYALAYKGLRPNETELRKKISRLILRIQKLDPIENKSGNKALARGLQALWNEDPIALREFIEGLDNATNIVGDQFYISSGFHIGGMTNPSGIHINLMSLSSRLLLADSLLQKLKESGERMYIPYHDPNSSLTNFADPRLRLLRIKKAAETNIKLLASRMSKAHLTYLNIAAYAITKDETLRPQALDSIYGLLEIPTVRSTGVMIGELERQPDWMYSSWPFEPWVAIKGPWIIDRNKLGKKSQRRGLYSYPIFECAAMNSSYVWVAGADDFPCNGNGSVLSFSIDYQWAYWLARSTNLISSQD